MAHKIKVRIYHLYPNEYTLLPVRDDIDYLMELHCLRRGLVAVVSFRTLGDLRASVKVRDRVMKKVNDGQPQNIIMDPKEFGDLYDPGAGALLLKAMDMPPLEAARFMAGE